MSELTHEYDEFDCLDEECPECGYVGSDCICDDCPECNGHGRIPVWDGYWQYFGDGCVQCPDCGGDGKRW